MSRSRSRLAALAAIACIAAAFPVAIAWASIDGTASIQFQINDRRSVGLNANVNIPMNPTPSVTFSNGVGASQANQVYQASRTLSGGADSVDLVSSSFKDSYGDNLAFVRVKGLYLKNTSTHTLSFGGGSNPWSTLIDATGPLVLPPGAFCVIVTPDATGWTVTATTGDLLNVTGTGTDTYDVAVLGGKS